jgi:hypothetical protein
MTETRLVSGIEDDWHKAGLPRNSPLDVAKAIAGEYSMWRFAVSEALTPVKGS